MTKSVVPSNLFTSVSSIISLRAPLCIVVVARFFTTAGMGEEVAKEWVGNLYTGRTFA